ncbi:MAG: sulfur carrier protein ThiS [Gemmatimonadales bacterium]
MIQSPESSGTITLTVNGAPRELAPNSTIAALLGSLGLDPRLVVVEHNRAILRDRDAYRSLDLNDGDVVEIVHFVGGG